jgi:hypothetical protein
MSLNSLLNEQLKQVLNRNTNNVIETITEKLNVSKDVLVDIWNKLNTDFVIKYKPSSIIVPELIDEDIYPVPELIDEDIPVSQYSNIEILEEDIYPEIKVEIIDENF